MDVLTGKRKWVLDFSKEIEKKVSFGSPALAKDGTIYISLYDDSYNGYLFAINKDGSMKWKFSKEGGSNIGALQASPSVGADGTIYVGSFGSKNKAKIYAINPDGSLKWSYKILENRITSGPGIGPDGTLYFGSHNFPYYPSSIANNDVKGHMYALRDLGFEGELKWKYEVDYGITASPAIDKDGNVFFATTKIGSSMPIRLLGDYQFYALNNRGQKLWSYPLKGYSWGSPSIGKDGTIYLGVMRGEAGVVAFGSSSEKCVESVWIPAVNTVCSNTAFTQTSNCENTRPASGTKICYTPSVTCPDIPCSSGYICEMREPREGGNQCTPNWFFGPPGGGR